MRTTIGNVAIRWSRGNGHRPRLLVAAFAAVTSMIVGSGAASAVGPTVARTSAGCAVANAADEANNVQTCRVWSESMQEYVTVKVRPSDQLAGRQEQAIYFLGGINNPSSTEGSLYQSKYNLVMISGSTSTWSSDWESPPLDTDGNTLTNSSGETYSPQWETFIGEELPAYLNQNFNIDQTGNAVVGLSISGGQAVNLALKYPEVFKVALSISGYYQTNDPFGWVAMPYILSTRQGISNGFDGMWDNPYSLGNQWANNDVAGNINAIKANNQTIIISTGNGLIASQAEWDELIALSGISEAIASAALEFVAYMSTVLLNTQALVFGLPDEFIYSNRAHTWQRWGRTDEEEAQKVQEALQKYETTSSTSAPTGGSSDAEQLAKVESPQADVAQVDASPVCTEPVATTAIATTPALTPDTTTDFNSVPDTTAPATNHDSPGPAPAAPSVDTHSPQASGSADSAASAVTEPANTPETSPAA